jgi:glutathione-independent formaldehyde dehydrogenase
MKAVVLQDTREIVVREVPDAEMRETTDALLRITSSAICGTDLHFYEGRMRGSGECLSHAQATARIQNISGLPQGRSGPSVLG